MQTKMIEEEYNEVPPEALFFSKRAKLVAKVTAEDLKATSEMLTKIQEEKTKVSSSGEKVLQIAKKAPKKPSKTRGQKKAPLECIEVEDDAVEEVTVTPEVTLSAAAKRRLKKLQKQRDLELQLVEAENEKILSAIKSSAIKSPEYNEIEEVPVDDFSNVNVLAISYLSEVSRLKCYDCDKFSTIFPKVAESFNLKVSEFLLRFREQIVKVDDTPKSLNITDSDLLECIPYKPDKSCEDEIQYDANSIKVMFQASDSKKKIDILVHKLEKMQDVMEKYSKVRDIPLNLLTFEFDGEQIAGTETPEDLDMESGNCIDVRVLTSNEVKKKEKAKEVIVLTVNSDSDSDILYVSDE